MTTMKTEEQDGPVWAVPGTVETDSEGRAVLIGGRCKACGKTMFPKAEVCPDCWSESIERFHLSRTGVLYSYSVVHVGRAGWKTPYMIGAVDFPEDGVRVVGPMVWAVEERPRLDTRVRVEIGRLRVDKEGKEVLSHRFVAER